MQTYHSDLDRLQNSVAEHCDDLIFAARCGSVEKVTELLAKEDADVNKTSQVAGGTALMAAAFRGLTEIISLLLEAGAEVDKMNKRGDTALSLAVFRKHEAAALQLASRCSLTTLDHVDSFGDTPLMDASRHGLLKLVKMLVNRGCKIDHKNKKGESALSRALAEANGGVVSFLMEQLGPFAAVEAAAAAAAAAAASRVPTQQLALATAQTRTQVSNTR